MEDKFTYTEELEPLEALTRAIVKQAAEDYRMARSYIFVYQEKGEELLERLNSGKDLTTAEHAYLTKYQDNQKMLLDCEEFFMSDWGEALSGMPGDIILNNLREEEIRPIRISNRIIGRLRKEENEKAEEAEDKTFMDDYLASSWQKGITVDNKINDARLDVSYIDEEFGNIIEDEM